MSGYRFLSGIPAKWGITDRRVVSIFVAAGGKHRRIVAMEIADKYRIHQQFVVHEAEYRIAHRPEMLVLRLATLALY